MPVRRTVLLAIVALCCVPTLVAAQFGESPLLVSPAQLAREIGDAGLVLLHVGPKPGYDAGHIPGARFVQMQDFSTPRVEGQLTLELPDEADLRARLEKLGISSDSRIVIVTGSGWGAPSTRVIWTLAVAGLAGRTRLLEGGSEGWQRAGNALTTDLPPTPAPGRLTTGFERSYVVDNAFVQSRIGTRNFHLIDARTPVFFEWPGMTDQRGERHEAGHIAGARNIPYNTLFNDSLQLLPRDSLRKVFANAGVQPGDTVVAYCHIGQQATVVLFAARLLGHPTRLYDGSMNDWETRKLPLENTKH